MGWAMTTMETEHSSLGLDYQREYSMFGKPGKNWVLRKLLFWLFLKVEAVSVLTC